ncbi:mechanosensitive ion channel domain-containing protein [Nocardioides sp. NPDC051685]|uniref:mechanosensitive ion channel domain-containing protein n=1 Tax=Nocardioides sp. NPDC051685 TaxID=3364334 RepID=UPI0037AF565B
MTHIVDIGGARWFGWAMVLIVGLPILLLILSEVHLRLVRRGSALASPVNRLRLWLLPGAALLVLLTQVGDLSADDNGVRIVATIVGVLAVSIALGALNALLFGNAVRGSWRERLPGIFIDLARLVLVVAGAAFVASMVWGFDVGGLWATLGVGSIVIGLALQNAIGSVVSGLLLLFEQPFRLGDTLDVAGVRGRVVEMNWRSTHLDTGSGVQVIPNSSLAAASFTNDSRPTRAHDHTLSLAFGPTDPPHEVVETVTVTAAALPSLRPGTVATVRAAGGGTYDVTLPLATASEAGVAGSTLRTRLWYAARRAGLTLDGVAPEPRPTADVEEALRSVSTTLELTDEEIEALAPQCRLNTFGAGEHIVRPGRVPTAYGFVASGVVEVTAPADSSGGSAGAVVVARLDRGQVVTAEALLRESGTLTATAVTLTEVLELPLAVIYQLVVAKHGVARRLSEVAEMQRANTPQGQHT